MNITKDGQSATLTLTPDLSAYTPSNLAVKSEKKRIFVSWDHPIVNGVLHPKIKGYRVYHSTDGSSYTVVSNLSIGFPRAMTFFMDFDPGTHYFKVSTLFKDGYESPLTSAVSTVHREGYGT